MPAPAQGREGRREVGRKEAAGTAAVCMKRGRFVGAPDMFVSVRYRAKRLGTLSRDA
jgi:hypothetical protein